MSIIIEAEAAAAALHGHPMWERGLPQAVPGNTCGCPSELGRVEPRFEAPVETQQDPAIRKQPQISAKYPKKWRARQDSNP